MTDVATDVSLGVVVLIAVVSLVLLRRGLLAGEPDPERERKAERDLEP